MLFRVASADTAHVSDVVIQRSQDSMAPIRRRDAALEPAAAQDVLDAKSDERRMFAIVIERVAAGDALDDEPSGFVKAGGDVRLLVTINPAIRLRQVATQCVGQQARGVQHHRLNLLISSCSMTHSRVSRAEETTGRPPTTGPIPYVSLCSVHPLI